MSKFASVERAPVRPEQIQIHGVGVHAIDMRRVDVAVDLTPCAEPVNVEIVIVGPEDEELCSVLLLDTRDWLLDKILHLRHDAKSGEHVLHVGVFFDGHLVAQAARRFAFPLGGAR